MPQVGQLAVVEIPARLGAQMRDEVLGGALPVDVEVLRGGVEEGEPCAVGGLLTAVEDRRVERASERVRVQVVDPAVPDDRGRGHGVDDAQDDRPETLLARAAPWRSTRAGGTGKVMQVRALRLVEAQCAGQGL